MPLRPSMAQEKDFFSLAFSALMGKGSVDLPLLLEALGGLRLVLVAAAFEAAKAD